MWRCVWGSLCPWRARKQAAVCTQAVGHSIWRLARAPVNDTGQSRHRISRIYLRLFLCPQWA